jgi:hypothetical protein
MRVALLACAALTILACSKTQEPEPTPAEVKPAPTVTAPAATSAAPASGPGEIAYDVPAAWKTAANPSKMRKATYVIPKAPGDASDGELAVSDARGGLDANIGRWAGQFGNATPKTEKRTVNGLAVTIVEIKGPYVGMGSSAIPNQMLLGAIVEGGEEHHFFKLVGPEKTVTAARKDFDALVASLHAK